MVKNKSKTCGLLNYLYLCVKLQKHIDMNLGEAIKTFRKKRGITQKELAEKSGISANALCSIEKDKAFPSKETIKNICDVLGIPTSLLLFSSLTDEDVPQDKLAIFKALQKPIIELFN